ncbi:MAG TPA: hypothetical protein VLI54_02625 [Bacillota bacterium]|nr:hypothetical protein [Bacillota bacterium]
MNGGDQKATNEPEGSWQYTPGAGTGVPVGGADNQSAAAGAPNPNGVEWTASEFVAHQKGIGWYLLFGGIGLVVAVVVYIITHDVFSVVVIGVLAGILGYATSRKPRVMTYRLDRNGLTIGQKFHPYGQFKSFAVIDEGAFASITFEPMKRFMPPVSIYFSPEDEQKIVSALASRLPMQPAGRDTFDQMLRRVRF